MFRPCVAVACCIASLPAWSGSSEDIGRLAEALGLDDVISVMRAEGLNYGREMQEELFAGGGGLGWDMAVDAIYNEDRMRLTVLNALEDNLSDTDIGGLLAFFTSQQGQDLIAFEVSAREALLDPEIEDAAEARLKDLRAEASPELDLIARFVDVNDLIESNVMGAMNANFAFYMGMIEGGAFDGALTESDVLADVWAQENDIREETDLWVHAYLAMAFQPAPDADVEAYIAISETREGQVLNSALFAGFDAMYIDISRALGVAAAGFMSGEDI
ncbi:MAG: hypothetical protein AAF566_00520 [Pseudomonadota bacterium]